MQIKRIFIVALIAAMALGASAVLDLAGDKPSAISNVDLTAVPGPADYPELVEVAPGQFIFMKSAAAGTGQIMGEAIDPKRNLAVPNIDVELNLSDGTFIGTTVTAADGTFSFTNLDFDDYHLVVNDPAYRPLDMHFTIDSDTLVQLPPVWLVPEEVVDIGDIGGKIKDVLTGQDIISVDLDFKKGIDPPDTEPVVYTTQTTGVFGNFNYEALQMETGVYTVYASKGGYRDDRFHVYVIGAEDTSPQNGWLSPVITGDEMRIILTWGFTPSDLDSHLWAPDPSNSFKYHLYYVTRTTNPYRAWFDLDLDDITSYGPETTTIHQWEPETYCFSVHNYTDKASFNSQRMSNSGARVAVLTATDTTLFYITPNTPATVWDVITIDGATKQLTPVNRYSFQSNEDYVGIQCAQLD